MRSFARVLFAAAALALLFSAAAFAQDDPQLIAVGSDAPDFELAKLTGEGKVKLSDLRGSVVMLDFWATWCGPCRKSLPHIQSIHKKYAGKTFKVFGVNNESDPEKVKEFLTENGYTIPNLLDTDRTVGNAYGVRYIPSLVIINKEGKVSATFVGVTPEDKIVEALKKAGLDLKTPPDQEEDKADDTEGP